MGPPNHGLEHPKKRRRREVELRPLAARLLFDDSVKGNAAIVSQSLWSRLGIAEGIYITPFLLPFNADTAQQLQMLPLRASRPSWPLLLGRPYTQK